ncbi:protein disulfide oxidoreductase [Candidatus Bipolaricaulota sp. J31]
MAYITGEDLEYIRGEFRKLPRKVTLKLFREEGSPSGDLMTELMEELAAIEPEKVALEVAGPEEAETFGIDKLPALTLQGDGEDYGVRFFGIPSGYEFASLLEAIRDVAAGRAELEKGIAETIAGVTEPIHIQVFVTPTCPYCPFAVRAAHKFAVVSPSIRADMVMAPDFPELSERYEVTAVPTVVINETVRFEGAIPEEEFAARILEAIEA